MVGGYRNTNVFEQMIPANLKKLPSQSPAMASGKSFADLPDELLLEIFLNLNIEDLSMSVQHVNSHWKEVSQDNVLWKNQIFSPDRKMTDEEIERRLRNMPALKAFCPQRGTNSKVIFDIICRSCRDIRHLDFKWSQKIRNHRLEKVLQKCQQLENLNIPIPKESDQLKFSKLLGQLQKLTTLAFTEKYVNPIVQGTLKAIADGCPSLQHIDLGYSTFEDQDIKYLLEQKGHQLLSFSIRCYMSTVAHKLLANCTNLEYLLYDNYNEDLPNVYMELLSNLSNLHTLSLSYFKEGQTRHIPFIFKKKSLPKLVKFSIFYCDTFDSNMLSEILRNCPELQSLSFRGDDGLTDEAFQHIGICSNLEYLDIQGCSSFTDKSMEYVGAGCHKLKHVDIGRCSGLTNKSIEYLSTGCKNLKYLNIEQCSSMADDVIEVIFKWKGLRVLNLEWNSDISGTHLHMVPSQLPHLDELNVDGCQVSNECLDKIQECMPHLKITRNYVENEESDVEFLEATFFVTILL